MRAACRAGLIRPEIVYTYSDPPRGGDMVSTGVVQRWLRAEDSGGLVKNRDQTIANDNLALAA